MRSKPMKIKPCPAGHEITDMDDFVEPYLAGQSFEMWHAKCCDDECTWTVYGKTKQGCIDRWNDRGEISELSKVIALLTEELKTCE